MPILAKELNVALDTAQFGWTALHYAASNGNYEVCSVLLQHGGRALLAAENNVLPAYTHGK